jgi:hypothetical protein
LFFLPGFGELDALNYQATNITDTPPISVTITPVAINSGEGFQLTNHSVATFTATIPISGVAGLPASDFTATTDWGDPSPDFTAGTITQDASNPSVYYVTGNHTFVNDGTYSVTTSVAFNGNSYTTTINGAPVTFIFTPVAAVTGPSATATVTQGPLTVTAFPIVGTEGIAIPAASIATFVDAGGAATIGDYTATISITNAAGTVVFSGAAASITQNGNAAQYTVNAPAITLPEEGVYQVAVTVTDSSGTTPITVTGASTATIADAPLTASATQPTVSQDEPTSFPLPVFAPPAITPASGPIATFTDANPTAPVSDFTAVIDWGDGTPTSAGVVTQPGTVGSVFDVTGSHTYADSGVNGGTGHYTIHVFVVDVGGSKLTITNVASVTDNPISVVGTLDPASDSGLSTGTPAVTNVNQPAFSGTVLATLSGGATTPGASALVSLTAPEAYAHVSLTATDLATGVATAIGTVQAGSDGSWNIKSTVALPDGTYSITATAVDQFGETTTTAPDVITSRLVIDTVGPVIDGMFFNHLNGQVDYIIKDPVLADGSAPSGVWVNTLLDSSNYLFTKVHANKAYPGKWVVTNVTATPDPTIPYAYDVAVTLNGGAAIKGGYYLFTIRDSSNGNSSVQDLAENHLDGVFYGSFPSGNGINGSDFVAELQAVHNKVFAPQTIIGTASPGNGGVGGAPVAPIHSGIWVPAVPRGGSPIFSTSTSPSNGADPPAATRHATPKARGQVVAQAGHGESLLSTATSRSKPRVLLLSRSHPQGPHRK